MIYFIYVNPANLITGYGSLTAGLNDIPDGAIGVTEEEYLMVVGHSSTCSYINGTVVCN